MAYVALELGYIGVSYASIGINILAPNAAETITRTVRWWGLGRAPDFPPHFDRKRLYVFLESTSLEYKIIKKSSGSSSVAWESDLISLPLYQWHKLDWLADHVVPRVSC